ncbi:MAG: MarR family transcriptional regulator [Clostridia bacterium]|nr:MarR family transcriptional regulator [Clostridia bacterium]
MENKRIFGLMCYLNRQLTRDNNVTFSEYGITPVQLHAMIFLVRSERQGIKVCQRDIEKQLNLRPSSVSTLLSNLEKGGFITRTVSDDDARTKFIELTEKGKCVCRKDKLLMDECDKAIQSVLTEEEQETFKGLLTKIIEAVTQRQEVKS